MEKWNFIIDVAKCENCHNCDLVTKDEHIGNDYPGYAAPQPKEGHNWVYIKRKVRGEGSMVDVAYMPVTCNHCDNAPCIKAAENGAVYKRPDGIVIIDPVKAKGQKKIVDSCPYRAISWNDELQIPQKWIFDAHLLDQGWKEPRWAQACPTGAGRALKVADSEMAQIAEKEGLEVLGHQWKTEPRVYYKNLHRYQSAFLGGTLATASGSAGECLEGVRVVLRKGDKQIAEMKTDWWGDFKFDKLERDSGPYRIELSHPDFNDMHIDVESVGNSHYCGAIVMKS